MDNYCIACESTWYYFANQITNVLTYIYDAPIQIKIMIFMMIKSIYVGFYKGIRNFRTSDNPVTQLLGCVLMYTLWGYIEAILWPITLPLFITLELDKIAKDLMRKNN